MGSCPDTDIDPIFPLCERPFLKRPPFCLKFLVMLHGDKILTSLVTDLHDLHETEPVNFQLSLLLILAKKRF